MNSDKEQNGILTRIVNSIGGVASALQQIASFIRAQTLSHSHTGGTDGQQIGPTALTTGAILLGYAEITANQTLTDNAETNLTGLSVTVTVPTGGRKIKITGYIFAVSSATSSMEAQLRIYESTTLLNRMSEYLITGAETNQGFVCMYVGTPSAGSHTYKLSFKNNISASTTIIASAINPAFILVELI